MMSNKTENAPMVSQEEAQKSVLRRTYISVEKPEVKNGQDLQDIDFSITNLDGKAYHRNETIVNSVRGSCKHCFQEFSLELEFLEHLQRSFKCVVYDTQCVVCKRYFNGDRGLNQHLIRSQCPGKSRIQMLFFQTTVYQTKAVIQSCRQAQIIPQRHVSEWKGRRKS